MKPLVGITPTPHVEKADHGTFRRHALSEYYSKAIEAAGGIPVMLPAHYGAVGEMLDRLDGLILSGGGDIDPSRFGQDLHPKSDGIDSERDTFEYAIFQEAMVRDMPVLGICRGLQLINTALGGTLFQDIAALKAHAQEHRQHSVPVHAEETFHTVTLTEGDHPLRAILGKDALDVNSFHHQGIEKLAEPLIAIAHADDGLIEAIAYPAMTFCMAVQWHPEMLAADRPNHAGIFSTFIQETKDYQHRVATKKELEFA